MKLLPVFIIFAIVYYTSGAASELKKIKGVKYTVYFPKLDSIGKLTGYDTLTKNLYFYGNQAACNFMYAYQTFDNGVFVKSELRNLYAVFTAGSKYGLIYDQGDPKLGRKTTTDSIIRLYWPNVYADSAISPNRNIVQFIGSSFNADSGTLTENYFIKDGIDTNSRFNLILKYSKRIKLSEYSFSKALDSSRQMKLYYYKATVKPRYFGKENFLTDSFETVAFFEEIPEINEKELLYYFNEEKKLNVSPKKNSQR